MKNVRIYLISILLFLSSCEIDIFKKSILYPFSNSLNKWGYMDDKGNIITQPQFDFARPFHKLELAVVKKGDKIGFVNRDGQIVINPQFDETFSSFRPPYPQANLFQVKKNEKWGYINDEGKIVIEFKYDDAGSFREFNLAPVKLDNKYGYINSKGEFVIEPQFEYARSFEKSGLAIVTVFTKPNPNNRGYINNQGEFVIEPQFANTYGFEALGGNAAKVEVFTNDWNLDWRGFIDKSGKQISWDWDGYFYESDLAYFFDNGKYGFKNKKGEIIIPAKFDRVNDFRESDLVAVKINEKWGFIDKAGSVIIEPQFDAVRGFHNSNLAAVGIYEGSWKWGSINKKGQLIIPMIFSDSPCFCKGMSTSSMDMSSEVAYVSFGNRRGTIDGNGNFLGFNLDDVYQEEARVAESKRIKEQEQKIKKLENELKYQKALSEFEQSLQSSQSRSNSNSDTRCRTCGGDGTVNCWEHDTNRDGYCTTCNNSGFLECYDCRGSGRR